MASEFITLQQQFGSHCFICGEKITDVACDILETETPFFSTPLADKLGEVIDNKYIVVISKEDKVCPTCIKLINHLDEIEYEQYITKNKILTLLEATYKLTCDVIEVENSLNCEMPRYSSKHCFNNEYDVNNSECQSFSSYPEENTESSSCLFKEKSNSLEYTGQKCNLKALKNEELASCEDKITISNVSLFDTSSDSLINPDWKHSNLPINPKIKQIPEDFDIPNNETSQTTGIIKKELNLCDISVTNDIYMCEICDIPFTKPYLLSRHKKVHLKNNKKVICSICNEECHDHLHYIYHRKNKHDILKRLTCSLCNQTFSSNKNLKNHLFTSHNNANLNCDSCGQNFKSYTQFSNHKLYAHGNKNCRVCGKHISDSIKLRQHENRHVWIDSKNLSCDVCGRAFKTPGGLRVHKVSHTGKYNFFCEFCGRGFMSSVILEEHKGVHTKEERYVCDICGRKFVLYSTFHLHKQWHKDPLPFPCNICKKRFKYRSVRSVHIRRDHTGENPYKCLNCNAEFLKSISLKKHMTLHTKTFPYNCGICFKGFVQKRNLSRHMSRVHNDNSFIQQPKLCEYKVVLRPDEFPSPNI